MALDCLNCYQQTIRLQIIFNKMDLALDNLQGLICRKNQSTSTFSIVPMWQSQIDW